MLTQHIQFERLKKSIIHLNFMYFKYLFYFNSKYVKFVIRPPCPVLKTWASHCILLLADRLFGSEFQLR